MRTDARRSADSEPGSSTSSGTRGPRPHLRRRHLRLPHRDRFTARAPQVATRSSSSSPPICACHPRRQPLTPLPSTATDCCSLASLKARTSFSSPTLPCATAHRRGHAPLHRPLPDGETYCPHAAVHGGRPARLRRADQPDLKGALRPHTVTAPRKAGRSSPTASPSTWGGEAQRAATTPLLSTYLVAVAAGPWHSVRTERRASACTAAAPRAPPRRRRRGRSSASRARASTATSREKFTEPYPSTPTTRRSSRGF